MFLCSRRRDYLLKMGAMAMKLSGERRHLYVLRDAPSKKRVAACRITQVRIPFLPIGHTSFALVDHGMLPVLRIAARLFWRAQCVSNTIVPVL
jgi:hypothetical protein